MDTCDVCGAAIDGDNPPAASEYQGETYCFCGSAYKEQFDTNPQLYVQQAA